MCKKTIRIIIITLVVLCIFTSMVMSQDMHHKDHCNEHNCPKCAIIMFAKTISELLKVFLVFITIVFTIKISLCLKFFKEIRLLKVSSLVYQNVQFNE